MTRHLPGGTGLQTRIFPNAHTGLETRATPEVHSRYTVPTYAAVPDLSILLGAFLFRLADGKYLLRYERDRIRLAGAF